MADFGVGLDKKKDLRNKLFALGIREEDIIEKFIRSKGPGGQNVNKTSTCVYLKHIPSGIEIKCQQERVQALNRYIARIILAEKIEAAKLKKAWLRKQELEKLRRKMRRRSKRAKLRLQEDKRRHSAKKSSRAKIRDMGIE